MSTYNNKYDILASTIAPNPASVKYWADLASNPNGGDLKYFYTTEEKNKLASLTNYSDSEVRELITALTLKVNNLEERVAALETPTI